MRIASHSNDCAYVAARFPGLVHATARVGSFLDEVQYLAFALHAEPIEEGAAEEYLGRAVAIHHQRADIVQGDVTDRHLF